MSEAEERAIEMLKEHGGSMLTSRIEDKTTKDVFGRPEPGIAIFRKLEKQGLVFFTEEEQVELEDGTWFTFTNEVCLVTGS